MRSWTAARAAPDVVRDAGAQTGLAVHLGSTDGRLEVALARTGRLLVHGLALEEAGRDKARAAIQQFEDAEAKVEARTYRPVQQRFGGGGKDGYFAVFRVRGK